MNGLKKFGSKIRVPALSISVALLVGALFIIFTDIEVLGGLLSDPIGALSLGIGRAATAYSALFRGAFGDPETIGKALASNGDIKLWARALRPIVESVVASVPLIFVGLGVSVAFRTGIFNIGGAGQYTMGAVGGTIAALAFGAGVTPAPIAILLVMIFGVVGGAAWAFIPGYLKARVGASEVITTIMLNFIAGQFVFFLVSNFEFIQKPPRIQPVSKELSQFVDLPGILPIAALRMDISIIIALLTAVAVSWFLFRSTRGFELRAAGLNLAAAKYAGIGAGTSIITAMLISGAISGLGGALVAVGTIKQLSPGIAGSVGFTAIAVALVGGTRPSGVVATALVFGLLQHGGSLMQVQTGIPIEMLLFIQALVIAFIAAPDLTLGILKNPFRRRPRSVAK
ncbi:MAG: ABC transporter permease [Candidatus Aquidulcis sp.]|nr:MAG: ABC transporter permease [Candidatus Aquidulcis sp.]RLT58937.1 MAG: ABC transporter permease [Candidatus Aquidulcis sp.]